MRLVLRELPQVLVEVVKKIAKLRFGPIGCGGQNAEGLLLNCRFTLSDGHPAHHAERNKGNDEEDGKKPPSNARSQIPKYLITHGILPFRERGILGSEWKRRFAERRPPHGGIRTRTPRVAGRFARRTQDISFPYCITF